MDRQCVNVAIGYRSEKISLALEAGNGGGIGDDCLEYSNTPADKENVNGEENDEETSVVACSCGSDVLCSICAESESEEADVVVEGEDEEAEGG